MTARELVATLEAEFDIGMLVAPDVVKLIQERKFTIDDVKILLWVQSDYARIGARLTLDEAERYALARLKWETFSRELREAHHAR
jgi:hypothetical protein